MSEMAEFYVRDGEKSFPYLATNTTYFIYISKDAQALFFVFLAKKSTSICISQNKVLLLQAKLQKYIVALPNSKWHPSPTDVK